MNADIFWGIVAGLAIGWGFAWPLARMWEKAHRETELHDFLTDNDLVQDWVLWHSRYTQAPPS